ncbi:ABC transporter ATP-binding protein [Pinisolibacter aquiterrae]|uniref:ABC transporter ATP-binding protein n=1 Tax=Pinisolibacter aquiterrae TaxID=2815579 RepID=UPI001C3C5B05|nr:ABC transporter ATP-binding protein [Pinisolibacter aquiterrae]MBV5266551.1 ABC transporter ATP-binding protein [Pinisolibacter aquiterrae]MCC8234676.1 ABC transporter ATP-binding protein [Pinisolibacter aquiterrae]
MSLALAPRTQAADASVEPLLAATGLATAHGRVPCLRDVAFTVRPGETIGLLGRNGMGKTTLLRTLTGLLSGGPTASIRFRGKDLAGAKPAAISRAGIALVPEGRGIFPNLTVLENLILPERAGPSGKRDWTLDRIFDLFPRLAERRTNWGDQLSGGEQQMLSIGRALMTNPELLMLDEATEGLAPKVRDEIWRTLRVVAETGMAIVVVDKNLEDLFELADRHFILAKGEIVFEGTTADLTAEPDLVHRWLGV